MVNLFTQWLGKSFRLNSEVPCAIYLNLSAHPPPPCLPACLPRRLCRGGFKSAIQIFGGRLCLNTSGRMKYMHDVYSLLFPLDEEAFKRFCIYLFILIQSSNFFRISHSVTVIYTANERTRRKMPEATYEADHRLYLFHIFAICF